jgi:hypothetical protein
VSLISEALRKARQEAAELRQRERGARIAGLVSEPVGRRRSRSALLLVVAVGAACLGAAGAWWGFHGRGPTAVAEAGGRAPVAVVAPFPTSTPTPAGAMARVDSPEPQPTPMPTGTAAAGVTGQPQPSSPAVTPGVTPTPAAQSAGDTEVEGREAPPSPTAAAQASPTPTVTPAEPSLVTVRDVSGEGRVRFGRSRRQPAKPVEHLTPSPTPTAEVQRKTASQPSEFLVTAHVGRVTLELDYLVYRPDDPFAQINGQEVHVGSKIEGFVVEEITRDFVRLRDAKGSLLLRVH